MVLVLWTLPDYAFVSAKFCENNLKVFLSYRLNSRVDTRVVEIYKWT